MAIQFKSEEQRKVEKKAKGKLHTVRTILLVCSIVAFAILSLYFMVCFNPTIVVLPLFFFWFLVVVIPSVFTIGVVWTSDGYKKFVADLTNMLGNSIKMLEKAIKVLWQSLPYIGTFMLLVIASYGVVSFLYYKKHKEDKKSFYHIISAGVIFILALSIFIIALVLLPKVKIEQL